MIQCQISSNLIMGYITNVLHPTGTGLAFLNAFSRLLASSDEIKAIKLIPTSTNPNPRIDSSDNSRTEQ